MAKIDFNNAPNAKMLQDVQLKSAKEINTNVVVNLPLSEIDENPDNASVFNMDDIKFLAKNIKEEGFLGAIDVYKKSDGRYEIISGHRRYRAMTLLNKDSIPAIIHDELSCEKKRRKLISSNMNVRNMNPMDIARMIEYHRETLLLERADKKKNEDILDQLATYFDMSRMNIVRYRKLISLIPELQNLVAEDKIGWTSIISCAEYDANEQKAICEKIKKYLQTHEKITAKTIENIVNKKSVEKAEVNNNSQTPIDRQFGRIHKKLRMYSQGEIIVANKNNLKKQISEIEKYIEEIKKKL